MQALEIAPRGTESRIAEQIGWTIDDLSERLAGKSTQTGVENVRKEFCRSWGRANRIPVSMREAAEQAVEARLQAISREKRQEARQIVAAHDHTTALCHLGVFFLAAVSMVLNGFSGMIGLSTLLNDSGSLLNTAAPVLPGLGDLRIAMRWFSLVMGFVIPIAVLICGAVIGRLFARRHRYCTRTAMFVSATAVFILGVSVVHCSESIHLLTGTGYLIAGLTAVGIDSTIVALEVAAVSVKVSEDAEG